MAWTTLLPDTELFLYLYVRKEALLSSQIEGTQSSLSDLLLFETIHPFLDGNGRLGRLLITFLLCTGGALQEPILYLSLYFKTNRQQYYDWLQRVRVDGDWEGWLHFFLTGVLETAEQASHAAQNILKLFEADRGKIAALKRAASSTLRVHELLQKKPLLTIAKASKELNLSLPTVTASLTHLVNLGIVGETSGKKRRRLYVYEAYMSILQQGTEPLRID